jgi:hypothetical protein
MRSLFILVLESRLPRLRASVTSSLAAMSPSQALAVFSDQFVEPRLRERFVHEAFKKLKVLHRRVCHSMSELFSDKHSGQNVPFADSEECLFLGWSSPFEIVDWHTASGKMSTGGGYLVIKSDGSAFYAETEGYPSVCYAGS